LEVAQGQVVVAVVPPRSGVPPPGDGPVPPRTSQGEEVARVRAFLWSLRIDPALYFERAGPVYPRAYLAALPSGEMVRQFSGEGGFLNGLDLEFPGEASLGADTLPTVELEGANRPRKTFHKILARIVEGVRTCCSGFAMVLPAFPPRSALPSVPLPR